MLQIRNYFPLVTLSVCLLWSITSQPLRATGADDSKDASSAGSKLRAPDPKGTFTSRWQTTTANETVTLPLVAEGTYKFDIDWGDGLLEANITSPSPKAHTYATPGTYTIAITGKIEGFAFNGSVSAGKIREIRSWGPLQLGDVGGYFKGATNLTITATDTLATAGITNMSSMFEGCSQLTRIPNMKLWDVANVTTMNAMFKGASSFDDEISDWDVSSVTDMEQMFENASSFNQPIGKWSIGNYTNMNAMFKNAVAFDQNLSSWYLEYVTTDDMFLGAGLSAANYDAMLKTWHADDYASPKSIHMGKSTYTSAAAAARRNLIAAGWTIEDGGAATQIK